MEIEPMRTHLSRLTLKRDASAVKPLLEKLLPQKESEAMNMHHRLLWTVFPTLQEEGSVRGKSPFLWRYLEAEQRFFVLGPQPEMASPFFKVETRPFDVRFVKGQKLAFELRANATVDRMLDPSKGREGRKRVDLVLDALHQAEHAVGDETFNRSEMRQEIADAALGAWLSAQGERNGFQLMAMEGVDYRTVSLLKSVTSSAMYAKGRKKPLIGISNMTGLLEVTDPQAFATKYMSGFGRYKAFGCGLMLLRPAPAVQYG